MAKNYTYYRFRCHYPLITYLRSFYLPPQSSTMDADFAHFSISHSNLTTFKKNIHIFYSMLWFYEFFPFFLVEKDHSICLHNLLQWRHWMQDSRITSKLIPVNLSLQIQPYLSVVDEIKRETIMQTKKLYNFHISILKDR